MIEWISSSIDDKKVEKMVDLLNVDKPIAQLLVRQGITSLDEAKDFFSPQLKQLHDPFLMKGMGRAVLRLVKAIEKDEPIMLYGDYDVDGTTSVSMMYHFLREKVSQLYFYIPDRYTEGYGLSAKGIEQAVKEGAKLMIVLDCGTNDDQLTTYAHSRGLDVIVCDHHEAKRTHPHAHLLNPKQEGCSYPCKDLSGCGVGFKLLHGYTLLKNLPLENLYKLLDILVVSIAADIVPIVGENRILAYHGLQRLVKTEKMGLRMLLELAQLKQPKLTISDIVFRIAPRINAAGRITHGKKAVELMISKDESRSLALAEELDQLNEHRKLLSETITEEAMEMLEKSASKERVTAVAYGSTWNKGVLGIVASKIVERYACPTIVLTEDDGLYKGSGRSSGKVNLYVALEACNHLLETFGGHQHAVGLAIKKENILPFIECLDAHVRSVISPVQLQPVLKIASEITLPQINPKFVRILMKCSPFGPSNMKPLFIHNEVYDTGNSRLVGKDKEHLQLEVSDKERRIHVKGIAFNQHTYFDEIKTLKPFRICFTVEYNFYNENYYIQLNIRDIKFHEKNS